MYPVNFTEKMSVNLTHAHTVCTRPSLSQREGPGDEVNSAQAHTQCTYKCIHVYMYNHVHADEQSRICYTLV